jgi:hypothetical protein
MIKDWMLKNDVWSSLCDYRFLGGIGILGWRCKNQGPEHCTFESCPRRKPSAPLSDNLEVLRQGFRDAHNLLANNSAERMSMAVLHDLANTMVIESGGEGIKSLIEIDRELDAAREVQETKIRRKQLVKYIRIFVRDFNRNYSINSRIFTSYIKGSDDKVEVTLQYYRGSGMFRCRIGGESGKTYKMSPYFVDMVADLTIKQLEKETDGRTL